MYVCVYVCVAELCIDNAVNIFHMFFIYFMQCNIIYINIIFKQNIYKTHIYIYIFKPSGEASLVECASRITQHHHGSKDQRGSGPTLDSSRDSLRWDVWRDIVGLFIHCWCAHFGQSLAKFLQNLRLLELLWAILTVSSGGIYSTSMYFPYNDDVAVSVWLLMMLMVIPSIFLGLREIPRNLSTTIPTPARALPPVPVLCFTWTVSRWVHRQRRRCAKGSMMCHFCCRARIWAVSSFPGGTGKRNWQGNWSTVGLFSQLRFESSWAVALFSGVLLEFGCGDLGLNEFYLK